MTVEHFIAGFHSRIDKIADLQIDDKLKGHLLLKAAALDYYTKNIIVGTAAGNFEISCVSSALRQVYRSKIKPISAPSMSPRPDAPLKKDTNKRNNRHHEGDTHPQNRSDKKPPLSAPSTTSMKEN